jgi:hypothetical protein
VGMSLGGKLNNLLRRSAPWLRPGLTTARAEAQKLPGEHGDFSLDF